MATSQIENEIDRLRTVVDLAIEELRQLTVSEEAESLGSAPGIFGVHLLILQGSSLISNIETTIRESQINSEWAVRMVTDVMAERQRSVDSPHLSDKYLDVKDVAERIIRLLENAPTNENCEADSVFVVAELMPSRLLELAKSDPVAIISEHGGWTSHTSILAREMMIPLVTGIKDINKHLFQTDVCGRRGEKRRPNDRGRAAAVPG